MAIIYESGNLAKTNLTVNAYPSEPKKVHKNNERWEILYIAGIAWFQV